MEYTLSTEIIGHTGDVRGLTYSPHNNCIISCSRDKSAKLWIPNKINFGYTEAETYKGHKSYVSSVCILPPTPSFPGGLILTGGTDNMIIGFEPQSPDALFEHKSHEDCVCKLVCGNSENVFLSASWDKSAKVWTATREGITCTTVFRGHQGAIWSVAMLKPGLVVTGSADKTINVYISEGGFVRKLEGHNDCVRDIALYKNDYEILSCSNDATIKHWDVQNGQCIRTIYGHPNFIYSISYSNDVIATCGEDFVLNIWHNDKQQTISLPAQSVWVVFVLPNKDIITGSSDGVIRVFTTDSKKTADNETLTRYQANVESVMLSSKNELGGIKISDLPGLQSLLEPGKSDGQTKLINENGNAVCYSWSASENKWQKVGDVTGASGGSNATSGKVLYNGKEYDFVFSVDVEDGKPPLKLPYNIIEDPWMAAQEFIHKNNLPQDYLEQVANFIISNTKTAKSEPNALATSTYYDPFTGSSRYVPGSASGNVNGNSGNRNMKDFPLKMYKVIDVGNLKSILDKLIAFNKSVVNPEYRYSNEQLSSVAKLGDISEIKFHQEPFELLTEIIRQWPVDVQFPVIDILRLAVRKQSYNIEICKSDFLPDLIKTNLTSSVPISNKVTTYRMICNLFCYKSGEQFVFDNKELVLQSISEIASALENNKLLQIAVCTAIMNLALCFTKKNDNDSQTVLLINIISILQIVTDDESVFRLLVGFGTIIVQCSDLKNLIDDNTKVYLSHLSSREGSKIEGCAKSVLSLLI